MVDGAGLTSASGYPNGWTWRIDRDYASQNGKNATTPLDQAHPYLNQGDYLYFGPGTVRYAWDFMYNSVPPTFSHSSPIVASMYAAGYTASDWAGHAGGVHRSGMVRNAYSNGVVSNVDLGEREDTGIGVGARVPLMQDSVLVPAVGSQWWAGYGMYGPHLIEGTSFGFINALFTDGSVERLSVK